MKPTERPAGKRRWTSVPAMASGIVMVSVLFVAALVWAIFGPDPPLVVGPRTTVVTEPIAADGLPDYEAAWLAMMGPAPPPADNAAVDLLRATWPMDVPAADLPAVCLALGIPSDPPERRIDGVGGMDSVGGTMVSETMDIQWPWRADERPALAAWLESNGDALDSLMAAADKPRCWFPSPSLVDGRPGRLNRMPYAPAQPLRDVVRLLRGRALLHLGEGRHDSAWRDLRAIRRWGRLLRDPDSGPGGSYVLLTSIAISGTAEHVIVVHLLGDPDLPPDLLSSIREEYSEADVPIDLVAMTRGDWLMLQDSVVWMARRLPGARSARSELALQGVGANPVIAGILATRLDWNAILEHIHAGQEATDGALRLPTYRARQAEADRLESAWDAAVPPPGGPRWSAGEIFLVLGTRRRTAATGSYLLDLGSPPASGCVHSVARCEATEALSRTAAALAAWRAERPRGAASYPERLDELVPRYLPEVPIDPFNDLPLRYERRGDGYLLLSVGSNGVDDGGDDEAGSIIDGEWRSTPELGYSGTGDHVVRMPVPPRTFFAAEDTSAPAANAGP